MVQAIVIKDILTVLNADAVLYGVMQQYGLNGLVYKSRTRKTIQVPGIYWSLINTAQEENEVVMRLQLSVYSSTVDELFKVEDRCMKLIHKDTERSFVDGQVMWTTFEERYDIESPDDGIVAVALDFRVSICREDR